MNFSSLSPFETLHQDSGDVRYKGEMMRSRLEVKWATFFDVWGISWEYEPVGFRLSSGGYLPDFFLPDYGAFFEVKGELRNGDADKISRFAMLAGDDGYMTMIGRGVDASMALVEIAVLGGPRYNAVLPEEFGGNGAWSMGGKYPDPDVATGVSPQVRWFESKEPELFEGCGRDLSDGWYEGSIVGSCPWYLLVCEECGFVTFGFGYSEWPCGGFGTEHEHGGCGAAKGNKSRGQVEHWIKNAWSPVDGLRKANLSEMYVGGAHRLTWSTQEETGDM